MEGERGSICSGVDNLMMKEEEEEEDSSQIRERYYHIYKDFSRNYHGIAGHLVESNGRLPLVIFS